MVLPPASFIATEEFARHLDEADPLRGYREQFHIPRIERLSQAAGRNASNSGEAIYLCGNSLGLQPRTAREIIEDELDDWAHLGVEAHFEGKRPWYPYHEQFRESAARLVGAKPHEVVMMNSLTVNLHLMMVSFYRPTESRHKVLIECPAFPSDLYAVQTHINSRGFDAHASIVEWSPREGEHVFRLEDFESTMREQGQDIELVLLGGVNFFNGQALPMKEIAEIAHRYGCKVGFDLAHAAGNVSLELHDWNVDFACWCSYKYLNSGPGAVAGCFVHDKHCTDTSLPRFGGWWGNDPSKRFRMHLEREFVPLLRADGWQLSNPPIMALAPMRASLDLFDEATLPALRRKSTQLTGFLRFLIERHPRDWFEIITPRETETHGCQLSILVHDRPRQRFKSLTEAGVVCDFREPNVIRVAPVPLYNTFLDCWQFASVLTSLE